MPVYKQLLNSYGLFKLRLHFHDILAGINFSERPQYPFFLLFLCNKQSHFGASENYSGENHTHMKNEMKWFGTAACIIR